MATASSSSGATTSGKAPIIIKKYANRRLYNTETSSYITLDHLAGMTRDGQEFQVVDARTGEDITRAVLAQIVMEGEAAGKTMLPLNFLKQIIAMYGDSMQAMVPHYLEASMAAFAENQAKFRDAALKPFEHLARQNLAMFQAATEMLTGARLKSGDSHAAPAPAPADADLSQLKAQLQALQARIDGMGKKPD
jgi:polyhydroxyalkanoate synthesis repressor PhaR